MKKLSKLVVFDLDETLGNFDEINDVLSPIDGKYRNSIHIYVRPKLKEGLSLLNGYTPIIASCALGEYIETALKAANIHDSFTKIYDRYYFGGSGRKTFRPIAKDFKIPRDSVSQNIVYVGNEERIDAPEKGSGIVFIEVDSVHENGLAIPMTSIATLIKSLDDENGFNSGFHRLRGSNSEHEFQDKAYRMGRLVSYVPKIELRGNSFLVKKLRYKISKEDIKLIDGALTTWDFGHGYGF